MNGERDRREEGRWRRGGGEGEGEEKEMGKKRNRMRGRREKEGEREEEGRESLLLAGNQIQTILKPSTN